MVNFVGELLDLSLQGEIIYILSWWLMAVIVVIVWKPQNLVRDYVSWQRIGGKGVGGLLAGKNIGEGGGGFWRESCGGGGGFYENKKEYGIQ